VGVLFFSIDQDLSAEPTRLRGPIKRYRLRTERYGYRIVASADPTEKALLRWEYNRAISAGKECRHHMHAKAEVDIGGDRPLSLDCHLPTGYVLIEHVLQFLFHDLRVQPRTPAWPRLLRESVIAFHEQFTENRYKHRDA
jgi:hypothetical protein